MRKDLKELQKLYDDDVNIIEHIKNASQTPKNTSEMITVSYDLQAGSYIQKAVKNQEWENQFSSALANELDQLGDYDSILEVGVGEATTLNNILHKLSNIPVSVFGFDISYSRIKYARHHLKRNNINHATLFMGDLFNAAFQDDSVDVVYTSHSLEPNGGREKEALAQLYRIARKYLVLFEPSFELASEKSRMHMKKHGYVQNLYSTAKELGYKIIEHKLLFGANPNSLNNTGVMIIEKSDNNGALVKNPLACPVTKAPLELIRNNYYCKESLLLYPVVDEIPCLLPENAIIATHYLDDMAQVIK